MYVSCYILCCFLLRWKWLVKHEQFCCKYNTFFFLFFLFQNLYRVEMEKIMQLAADITSTVICGRICLEISRSECQHDENERKKERNLLEYCACEYYVWKCVYIYINTHIYIFVKNIPESVCLCVLFKTGSETIWIVCWHINVFFFFSFFSQLMQQFKK